MSQNERAVMSYLCDILGNRHTIPILWFVSHHEESTYDQIRGYIIYITNTDLKSILKQLMDYHILSCRDEKYSVTKKGAALVPILKEAYDWGVYAMKESK